MIFALGVIGVAATTAMLVPQAAPTTAAEEAPAAASPIATQGTRQPQVAPQGYGMVSNSAPAGPAMVLPNPSGRGPPPIVAIPRIPGPADMTIAGDQPGEVRTVQSFASNEACDEALPAARRRWSDAVCISTTPPPPPPEYGFLYEVRIEDNEMVRLETHPSMAACERALAARPARPGHQAGCSPKFH